MSLRVKAVVLNSHIYRGLYAFKQIIMLSLKLDAVVVVAIRGWGAKEKNGSTPTFLLQLFLVSCYVAPPGSWLRRELLAVLQLTTCMHRLLKMRMARGDSKALSQNSKPCQIQPKLSCPLDMILVMKTVITMINDHACQLWYNVTKKIKTLPQTQTCLTVNNMEQVIFKTLRKLCNDQHRWILKLLQTSLESPLVLKTKVVVAGFLIKVTRTRKYDLMVLRFTRAWVPPLRLFHSSHRDPRQLKLTIIPLSIV